MTSIKTHKFPPLTGAKRSFGVVALFALIGTSLVACGGNAVPPGTTNASYSNLSTGAKTQTRAKPAPVRRTPSKKTKTPPKKTAALPFVPLAADTLAGLSEKAVVAKLGEPELIRSEGQTMVWQYRSSECSFDMFFMPVSKTGAKSDNREVRHMLARKRRGNDRISVQACLDQVRKERRSQG
ncbi:hypothetical protein [Thalassospira lucentensis]|uniref:hypothetical protein n=1 Tax=Thalassospira lucentensis TaxID=168935 RepID=UPI00142E3F43|nr:hypothetical protein [Thalassospira lucentensis]NIZ00769.1 hypothetical protein [Thalassospira lucentensis]